MIRPSRRRGTLLRAGLFAPLLLPLVAFASCADSNEEEPRPDASAEASPDAVADGGCDAADEACAHALSCDEAPWCPVPTGLSEFAALTAIWGSGKNDVWTTGSNGTVMHWDGAAWTATTAGVKNTFNAIWGSGPSDVWIASATDTVYRSRGFTGAGTEWTRVRLPVDKDNDAPIFAISGTTADDLRLAGQAFVLFEGEDAITNNGLTKIALSDGGVGWKGSPGEATVLGVWSAAASDVWLVSDNSASVSWQRSLSLHGRPGADGGPLTWTEIDTRASVTLRAIWGSSADDVWAVGDNGAIRHVASANASEWQVVASPTRERLRAVWGSAKDDVWAVGDGGAIVHYDGKTWTTTLAAFPLGKRPALYGVWGSRKDDVWIVGDGIVLHYTGGSLEGGSP